jgi:hypothetical protein
MSVLQNQTYATVGDPFFVPNTNNINFLSSINVFNGSINVSEINLDAIRMDCAILNSTPTLLLNGVPVAATSSFTSSITTWSSYPALSPITYAVGGGTANLNNINALTSLSSATVVGGTVNANAISTATATISSINGAAFPSPLVAARNVTGATLSSGRNVTVVDLAGLAAGFYFMTVYIGSGGLDPFSCSTTLEFIGGTVTGGGFHCPSLNGLAPSFANCVSIQDDGAGSSEVSVIVYTNDALAINAVPQISLWRLT